MAPPQRGLPAPRPLSGSEPRSIQRGEGGGAARGSEEGWRRLLAPRGRGASREGADEGLSGRHRLPGLPPLSQALPLRSAPRQPRLRLPKAPRHPAPFIGRIEQAPALGFFRRRPKSASPRLTRREREARSLRRHLLRSPAAPQGPAAITSGLRWRLRDLRAPTPGAGGAKAAVLSPPLVPSEDTSSSRHLGKPRLRQNSSFSPCLAWESLLTRHLVRFLSHLRPA